MQVLRQRFACQVLRTQRADRARAQGWLWDGMLEEGHVWRRRFSDFVVWSEPKRVEKLRYMHRNPVKRGLVLSVQMENMRSRTTPTYRAAEGFVSLCLLQSSFVAYVELLMISIWASEPAWNRFTASQLPVDGAERDHGIIRLGLRTYELLVSAESKAQDAQNLI